MAMLWAMCSNFRFLNQTKEKDERKREHILFCKTPEYFSQSLDEVWKEDIFLCVGG